MEVLFNKKEEVFTFYNNDGEKIERTTEVRFDPLTGETSRIVPDPGMNVTAPDYREVAEQTRGKKCPFCPENVEKVTPVFSKEVSQEERIRQGESIVFPNLFPYSKHNGVVVMTNNHYVRLNEFTISMLKDSFIAAQKYLERVQALEEGKQKVSINWNYLPPSGGSILHPHLHVIASNTPTNRQEMEQGKLQEFKQSYTKSYYQMIADVEREEQERWIGEKGSISWMHAFAPKSHHDYIAVFHKKMSLEEVTPTDWEHFAQGLISIFAAFAEEGMASFNMMISGLDSHTEGPIHARIIPRLTLGNLDTSDINFFQALHQEPLSYKVPENNAEKARKHFK